MKHADVTDPTGREAFGGLQARKDIAAGGALVLATTVLFGVLFNRETALSYSIGYNLYTAERFVEGAIPYVDFHSLYPPGTLLLNALVFRLFGVSLYSALFVVMVFKVLTTLVIFLCGRLIMPVGWAMLTAAFSLVWLRPNGPFKAVPMHYGALFLALSVYSVLKCIQNRNNKYLFAAGLAAGLLAVFKHNVGLYLLAGLLLVIAGGGKPRPSFSRVLTKWRPLLWVAAGVASAVVPISLYMASRGALTAMIRTLVFGPGEFLLERLTGLVTPAPAVLLLLFLGGCAVASSVFNSKGVAVAGIWSVALIAVALFALAAPFHYINSIIFFGPAGVLVAALFTWIQRRDLVETDRSALLCVLVGSTAALLEAFPRFAREQPIASMPFVMLALVFLLYLSRGKLERLTGGKRSSWLALSILPVLFFATGLRLASHTFFDSDFRMRSAVETDLERARGVFFPSDQAWKIEQVVTYIQRRVPEDEPFFPHSYEGSVYLFLADRDNVSRAQFWGGVGVTDAERFETLRMLEERRVRLVVTRYSDFAAERYQPMREYLTQNFALTQEFGDVVILERMDLLHGVLGH